MRLRKFLTAIGILVLLLLLSPVVFADDKISSIDPHSGAIDIGEYGFFYDVDKDSDGRLKFCVLTQNGEKTELLSADIIKVVELDDSKGRYTAETETEYSCTDDEALSKLKTFSSGSQKPYIAGYKVDVSGKLCEICLPGYYWPGNRRDTNFGTSTSTQHAFKFSDDCSEIVADSAYKLYDTPVIYAYNYDFYELEVSVMDVKEMAGEYYRGYIYDTTDDGQVKLMLITLPDTNNDIGIIHSVTEKEKNYELNLYNDGVFRTLTADKKTIDNYNPEYPGTDYSNKISSGFYPGAVITYGKSGQIKKIYPLTSKTGKASDQIPYYQTEFYTLFNSSPYRGIYKEVCECMIIYGKVTAKNTSNKVIAIETTMKRNENDPPEKCQFLAMYSSANIFVVDYRQNDENIISSGSAASIREGDYVLIRKSYGATKDIVVYKNFNPDKYLNINPVKRVTLNKTEVYLNVDNIDVLKATVAPFNAISKKVIWSSSNPSVAEVSDGIITAKAQGSAIITVTTDDGGKTAQCEVTVGAKQQMWISDVTKDNGIKFKINISPEPRGRLFSALYDSEGNIIEVHNIIPDSQNTDVEFINTEDKIKIMWLDSELRPYTNVIEFNT